MLKTSFATGVILAYGIALMAQVQTEVPPVVPGARPFSVGRIKVQGASVEGNLEGNTAEQWTKAVWSDIRWGATARTASA